MRIALGDKIRLLRLGKGLSQQNMAHELGLSIGAYSNIERGKTAITVLRLELIAGLLKTSIFTLLDAEYKTAINERGTSYLALKRVEEKLKEMEKELESKAQEINYLKEIIVLMKRKTKGA